MPAIDHSQPEAMHEVDCLIKAHLVEHAIRLDDSRPVATIGEAVIDSIASRSDVDEDFVRQRLRTICEQVGSKEGVPTYQMKVDEE